MSDTETNQDTEEATAEKQSLIGRIKGLLSRS